MENETVYEAKLDGATARSLNEVLSYLYGDERKHWEELGQPEVHIYHDVVKVADWLKHTTENHGN